MIGRIAYAIAVSIYTSFIFTNTFGVTELITSNITHDKLLNRIVFISLIIIMGATLFIFLHTILDRNYLDDKIMQKTMMVSVITVVWYAILILILGACFIAIYGVPVFQFLFG